MPSSQDLRPVSTGGVATRQFEPNAVAKYLTIVISCLVMVTSGSLFTFSSFSQGLKTRFSYSSSDINLISAIGNSAVYVAYMAVGPFYDRFRVKLTMALGFILYGLGYLLMYLAYMGTLKPAYSTVGWMSFYYFITGCGGTGGYMAAIGVNITNFPSRYTGVVSGILLLFYGLSGTIFSQLYYYFYSAAGSRGQDDTGGFLLFLCCAVSIVNALGILGMSHVPRGDDRNQNTDQQQKNSSSAITSKPNSTEVLAERTALLGPVELSNHENPKSTVVITLSPLPEAGKLIEKLDIPVKSARSVDLSPILPASSVRSLAPSPSKQASILSLSQKIRRRFSTLSLQSISLSPMQILKSPLLWFFTMTFVWQQGLTYITNISSIIAALSPPGADVSKIVSVHLTIISVCQSVSRFSFAVLCDLVKRYSRHDRSFLLIITETILVMPCVFLAAAANTDAMLNVLYLCSALVGWGFGCGGALFPPLTKDFFGTAFYGNHLLCTACGLVMLFVPVGIILSNLFFGRFYDEASSSNASTFDGVCYGGNCFQKSFILSTGIQVIPVLLSIGLFVYRSRESRGVAPVQVSATISASPISTADPSILVYDNMTGVATTSTTTTDEVTV